MQKTQGFQKPYKKRRGLSLAKKQSLTGWLFLSLATILIFLMFFYPMLEALLLSFKAGIGANIKFAGLKNYQRLLQDKTFLLTLKNSFIYLIIQVPIMLLLALMFASMLNNPSLKLRGVFRTAIFLPCATSLVSYSIIFRSFFSQDGFFNLILSKLGLISENINWLADPTKPNLARMVIIIALLWRWTGYNMIFYLSGLQNIHPSIYEAAKIDGAGPIKQFFKITVPLLKPTILLTAIMSTNGTLQLFDESFNLTLGGPTRHTMTMSHYIYHTSFVGSPKLGYAAAMSFVILILVAALAFIQMKVGDKRDY